MPLRRSDGSLRIFFASDLHASERCFRKFVAAAQFYDVDLLMLGGDLTGKRLVAMYTERGRVFAAFDGDNTKEFKTAAEGEAYEGALADAGAYVVRVADRDALRHADRSALFDDAARARLERWVAYAEDKLRGTGVRIVVIPGNDDPLFLNGVLKDSEVWLNVDGRVASVATGLQVAGLGCSTPTPWKTPRELTDGEIDRRLTQILEGVDPSIPLVLDVHVPPYGSGLDTCPVLDAELRPVVGPGGPLTAPVGSRALHRHIVDRQPFLALHGHIHEGRGCTQIGRTLCANPGSQYWEGRLLGFLAVISGDEVKSWMLTEG